MEERVDRTCVRKTTAARGGAEIDLSTRESRRMSKKTEKKTEKKKYSKTGRINMKKASVFLDH